MDRELLTLKTILLNFLSKFRLSIKVKVPEKGVLEVKTAGVVPTVLADAKFRSFLPVAFDRY